VSPEAVLAHLADILASPTFRTSRRSQEFLSYIVRQAIDGHPETLKERVIGQDVFRRADYDPANDTAVRVAAGELRKKLTHYYEANRDAPVRIELAAGSYVPEFRLPVPLVPMEGPPLREPAAPTVPLVAPKIYRRRVLYGGGAVAALAVLATCAVLVVRQEWLPGADRDLAGFWEPFLIGSDSRPVLICLGGGDRIWLSSSLQRAIEQHPGSVRVAPGDYMVVTDEAVSTGNMRAVLSIATLLERRGRPAEVRWPREIQAAELRHRRTIFIGTFNNPWTLEMTRNVRFALERDQSRWYVRDRTSSDIKWSLAQIHPAPMTRDYAVITRIVDPTGGRALMSAGGITQFGTEVAGEFLADAASWRELARGAPPGWTRMNLQVVLETTVVDRKPSRPRVLATHFW
jgi:hypothetical protein